jgi:hypothetical protein
MITTDDGSPVSGEVDPIHAETLKVLEQTTTRSAQSQSSVSWAPSRPTMSLMSCIVSIMPR